MFKVKKTRWHRWFAWHPVFIHHNFGFSQRIVWLRWVERRWFLEWTDGSTYFPGFYQYQDTTI